MRDTGDVTGGKPIAVLLQSISGVSAISPLVAFYDIHGGKREVLFFYFVPDTTRDRIISSSDCEIRIINRLNCLNLYSMKVIQILKFISAVQQSSKLSSIRNRLVPDLPMS
jgi:hypothetical protein